MEFAFEKANNELWNQELFFFRDHINVFPLFERRYASWPRFFIHNTTNSICAHIHVQYVYVRFSLTLDLTNVIRYEILWKFFESASSRKKKKITEHVCVFAFGFDILSPLLLFAPLSLPYLSLSSHLLFLRLLLLCNYIYTA